MVQFLFLQCPATRGQDAVSRPPLFFPSSHHHLTLSLAFPRSMDVLMRFVNARPPLEIAVGAFTMLLSSYWAAISFYRLFLSPLRKIPGPWYAAISHFWLTTHVLRLRRCRAIDELLLKYGHIVRVAPNKVIFNDVPTTKIVYGVSAKLDKSEFYSSLKDVRL